MFQNAEPTDPLRLPGLWNSNFSPSVSLSHRKWNILPFIKTQKSLALTITTSVFPAILLSTLQQCLSGYLIALMGCFFPLPRECSLDNDIRFSFEKEIHALASISHYLWSKGDGNNYWHPYSIALTRKVCHILDQKRNLIPIYFCVVVDSHQLQYHSSRSLVQIRKSPCDWNWLTYTVKLHHQGTSEAADEKVWKLFLLFSLLTR